MTQHPTPENDDPWQTSGGEAERDYLARLRSRRILPLEVAACIVVCFIILASVFDAGSSTSSGIDRITTSSTTSICDSDFHMRRDC